MLVRVLFTVLLTILCHNCWSNTWQEAMETKHASLRIQWIASEPFIFRNQEGELVGIEYELIELFKEFVKTRYQVELETIWEERPSFSGMLRDIRTETSPNLIAVSAFSITEERKKFSKFSAPYLHDITVLVSSKGTPIVHTYEEIDDMMTNMTAVTIRGTVYQELLENLKVQLNIDFPTTYIDSDENILQYIQTHPNHFGFIDLPIYLMLVRDGGELTRQNFFTSKGTGYGFLMAQHSDWKQPLDLFILDRNYQKQISDIISKYMSPELYLFIDEIYNDEQISTSILTKEKELQLALIQNANLKLEQEQESKKALIIGIVSSSFLMIVIALLYFKNQKTTKLIISQKEKIEAHEKDISQINEQLVSRNKQLIAINEEKNNLVQILAHDLRSPLSQIISPADLLQAYSDSMNEEDKVLLKQIEDGAKRINKMITKILNVDSPDNRSHLILKEPIDVLKLFEDLESNFSTLASEKNIALGFKPCQKPTTLESDRLLLHLILENLISNAIKFSPKNSSVLVDTKCFQKEIHFGVHDNGPGFSEKDKELLFQSFQKLSAKPTAGEESTGLGLSIVKKYVSELGGKVWLESNEDNGSSFYVSIPF